MHRSKISKNYKILRSILSKTRQIETSPEMSYIIVYAFLYKYCSDIQKDYFLGLIQDKPITLDEAFNDEDYQSQFRQDALKLFGYYIPKDDLFLDEVIGEKYSESFFIHEFIKAFSKNVEFDKPSLYKIYFKFIFDSLKREININKFEFEGENHLIVKDLIYTISKLDVFEKQFPFEKVFDRVCDSKLIHVEKDPEYINSILSAIITSQKSQLEDVYNPFLNDASSLISLSDITDSGIKHIHAKSVDRIRYCVSVVKFLINFIDLDNVFLSYGSPFESVDVSGVEFDAVISTIPPMTTKRYKRLNTIHQNEIIKKRNKNKLKNVLSETFGVEADAFENDLELNSTLEDLAGKMIAGKNPEDDLTGEYEVLKNSEYLFLINLINSLKPDGIMAVSMSQSFLFKNSLEKLRKYLTIEKNYIDCVISIPDELTRPRRPDVIVVFRKNKKSDDVVFIDLANEYDIRRGEYIVPGSFKKNLVLSTASIDKVISVYNKRKTIDRFSNVVSVREIGNNEFNLSISRYVDTFEGDFIRLEDLKNQKEEITHNIRKLNKKIDMMMDDLGIDF